jgi:DNA-binding LytR/AlgR family response regulator
LGAFRLKIIICDDEIKYVESIKTNVFNYFNENFQSPSFDTFTDGEEIMNADLGYYDLAFLDIEMGKAKGTDIAKTLKKVNRNIVIFFITAYNQYLDDAMDLDAFRFLTKPLDIRRLFDGLDKAMELIDNTIIEFMLKDNTGITKISASEIIYIEICGRFTKVVTQKNTYLSENNINFWQGKLTATYFYSVHKSFIINTNYITRYNRDSVILDNQFNISIANNKRAPFRQYFLRKIEGR